MSKVSTLSSVLVGLASLTPDELTLVIQQAQSFGGEKQDTPAAKNKRKGGGDESELTLFYMQVSSVLKQAGLRPSSLYGFQKTPFFRPFKTKFESVLQYTQKNFPKAQRRDRQKLYRIYAELIVDWLQKNPKVPFSLGVFFRNIHQIPTLMVRAFPGYAQQGWLPLILKFGSRGQTQEQELSNGRRNLAVPSRELAFTFSVR